MNRCLPKSPRRHTRPNPNNVPWTFEKTNLGSIDSVRSRKRASHACRWEDSRASQVINYRDHFEVPLPMSWVVGKYLQIVVVAYSNTLQNAMLQPIKIVC